MGQSVGKETKRQGEKGKKNVSSIPPDSPLAELLVKWNDMESWKELEKPKMIYYCLNVWPNEKIIDGPVYWPCYGTKEKWIIEALYKVVEARTEADDEERMHSVGCNVGRKLKYTECPKRTKKQN